MFSVVKRQKSEVTSGGADKSDYHEKTFPLWDKTLQAVYTL